MRFEDFVNVIESRDLRECEGRARRPDRDDVRAVQDAMAVALRDSSFVRDCIERELCRVATSTGKDPALWISPSGETQLRLFYWWPGEQATPHEHTAFTVTGVMHNRLRVVTYDHAIAWNERRLVQRKVFDAERGRAGHIYEPCIHDPGNPTDQPSTSLHLFSRWDRPRIEKEVGLIPGMDMSKVPLPEPTADELPSWKQVRYRVLVDMLGDMHEDTRAATELLEEIAREGDAETRRAVDCAVHGLRRGGTRSAQAPASTMVHP